MHRACIGASVLLLFFNVFWVRFWFVRVQLTEVDTANAQSITADRRHITNRTMDLKRTRHWLVPVAVRRQGLRAYLLSWFYPKWNVVLVNVSLLTEMLSPRVRVLADQHLARDTLRHYIARQCATNYSQLDVVQRDDVINGTLLLATLILRDMHWRASDLNEQVGLQHFGAPVENPRL